MTVVTKISAVFPEIALIMPEITVISLMPVICYVPAIMAHVIAVMTDIHSIMGNFFFVKRSTALGLGGCGEEQTCCDEYGKLDVHNFNF